MKSRSGAASYPTLGIHGLTEKFEGDSTRAYLHDRFREPRVTSPMNEIGARSRRAKRGQK